MSGIQQEAKPDMFHGYEPNANLLSATKCFNESLIKNEAYHRRGNSSSNFFMSFDQNNGQEYFGDRGCLLRNMTIS